MKEISEEDFSSWLSSQGINLTEGQAALCRALIAAVADPQVNRLLRGGAGSGKTYAFRIFERYCHERPLTGGQIPPRLLGKSPFE